MIKHLRTNTLIQSRMTTVSGYKQAFATVTALVGALQPLSNENAVLADGVYGQVFQFFCEGNLDVQEGDKLKDTTTGDEYRVKAGGVVRRSFNAIDYLKVICEKC